MKNIILIIVFTFLFFGCKAQEISLTTVDYTNVPDGAYVKDFDGKLNPFVGTWKWVDGNSEFTVVLVKKEMYDASGINPYREDMIMGGYKYIENGVEIVNTLNFTTEFDPNDVTTFNSYANIITNINSSFIELSMNLTDIVKNKLCKGTFKLLNGTDGSFTQLEAQWKIRQRETFTTTPSPEGFSIPTEVVLTKQ